MRGFTQKIYVFLSIFTVCLLTAALRQTHIPAGDEDLTTGVYLYELREYDGQIALFSPGEKQPLYVFRRDTRQLPEADRAALRAGIFMADENDLRQTMEDFFE